MRERARGLRWRGGRRKAMPTVGIIGTLDTKGAEFAFLRERIHAAGVETGTLDCGVLAGPHYPPEVGAEEVAAAGGSSLAELAEKRDRGEAIAVMARGAAAVAQALHAEG